MFVCAKIVSYKGVIYVVDIIMSSQLKEDDYFKICKECDFNLIEGNGIGGIILRHSNEQNIYNIEKFNLKEKLEIRIFESKHDVMGFIFDEKLKDNRLFTQVFSAFDCNVEVDLSEEEYEFWWEKVMRVCERVAVFSGAGWAQKGAQYFEARYGKRI